jgi:hypothetical protein
MKKVMIRSQDIAGRVANVCFNCNKEFKKVIDHHSVLYCSAECAKQYEEKKK